VSFNFASNLDPFKDNNLMCSSQPHFSALQSFTAASNVTLNARRSVYNE